MSANYTMTIYQGTTFKRSFQIKEDSTILDITGYSFEGAMAQNYHTSTTTSFTTAITDAADGTFTISLTDTQTAGLTAGRYVYNVKMTDTATDKTQLLHGEIIVEDAV